MASGKAGKRLALGTAGLLVCCGLCASSAGLAAESVGLWQLYESALKNAKYVDLNSPVTNRMHCVTWSDWATQPKVEAAHGINLDTTY